MKHKMIIAMCCVLMLCSFTGCQLAKENAETNVYEDKLVGVLVTTEHLDLFDFESYLNDNLKGFSGGEITVEGNTQKYQGRLYATLTTSTLTSEETGEIIEVEEYIFEDIQGIPYFSATVPAAPGRDSYRTSMSDEAISDSHMHIDYGDDKNTTTLEGTIYTSPSKEEHIYYLNPVYQSVDGRVYAVVGSGFMVNDQSYSEGSVYSQTLDATTTVTENGKAKTESTSITLSISIMIAPEKIAVLQMDAESSPISREEYAADTLPETFVPESETDYLIVETYKHDDTGSLKISREIYGRDDENIETFVVRDDSICVKNLTQIDWE